MRVAAATFRYAVGREKIREFARATGERNPLHLDLDAARAAGFRDLVAPPMFAAVYAGPSFREALWAPALAVDRKMTVHGGQDFRFAELVVAGDELSTVAEVTGDAQRGANRVVTIVTTSTNQGGRVVTTGIWTVVVRPRRSSGRPEMPS